MHVVRHERVGHVPLDDGVPRVGRLKLVAVVHLRLGEVGRGGGVRERRQDVERGNGPRRVENARRLGRDARAERFEELQLARR